MGIGNVLIARQRMADENSIRPLRVQFSVRLVGNAEGAERNPRIHMEWASGRQAQELAMRRVRLTPGGGTGIGEIDLRQGPTPECVRYYEQAVRFLEVCQI
jgi:hypothetical protein